jgi:Sulfotransferase family
MSTPTGSAAPLLFLHIPKAAGTTLSAILRHHYPGRTFESGVNVFQRLELAHERFQAAARRSKVRALSAEVTFGLAVQYLPEARYLTILREPVDRALSQIWYFKAGHGAGHVPPGLPPPSPDLTVDELIGRGYVPDNLQTRMLCGLVSPFDALPADALEQAKRTLSERVAYVGTAERFDEFVALLNLELGWPTLPYAPRRVNPESRGRDGVTATELRRLEETNALDRELFEHADHLLTRALNAAGPALADELEVLRRTLPFEYRARMGKALDVGAIRALPVDARVALALKEAELDGARTVLRRKRKRLRRLREKLAGLKQPTHER